MRRYPRYRSAVDSARAILPTCKLCGARVAVWYVQILDLSGEPWCFLRLCGNCLADRREKHGVGTVKPLTAGV